MFLEELAYLSNSDRRGVWRKLEGRTNPRVVLFFSLVCLVVFPMRRVGFYGDLSALQDFVLDF